MNAFIIIVTLFAAPVSGTQTVSLGAPVTSFEVSGKTEKAAQATCDRFVRAAFASKMIGTCTAKDAAPVASAQ